MNRVVLATRNPGKVAELRQLLAELYLDFVDAPLPVVEETGATFAENAVLKARTIAELHGLPALADDSGLEVDALGGEPGVYSARYAGLPSDDEANNAKLLLALAGVPHELRSARFKSVVAYVDPFGRDGEQVFAGAGVCEGRILDAPRGTGGFGYDPLFYCPELGMTFAEAGTLGKGTVSHRARALAELLPKLRAYFAVANQPHRD